MNLRPQGAVHFSGEYDYSYFIRAKASRLKTGGLDQ
jgi:hypothetical protein